MNKNNTRILSLLLIFTLALSTMAAATAVSVPASDYIQNCSADISSTGRGNVKVSFSITGTGTMDSIGASSIYLYESTGSGWKLVKSFLNTQSTYSYMMASNTRSHSGNVTYSGTSGKQYYATVYFWAGKNGGGDSASRTTSVVTA